jgi:NADH:ubiquinone oxidoreductase subunit K
MEIALTHYLVVAAILFTIGVFGIFLNRKNVIVILMSIELLLLSVNLNLVAFSSFLPQPWLDRRRRRQSDERLMGAPCIP